MTPVPSIHIVYASTSGHTEYVCDVLDVAWKAKGMEVEVQRAEKTKAEDLLRGDILIIASSTWNTGNVEGQLNPHMYMLLDRAKDLALAGKRVAVVALGDHRYRYTANAGNHIAAFVQSHGGELIEPRLEIVNEPYGQEEKVQAWARNFLTRL
jgi:flavodoxin I